MKPILIIGLGNPGLKYRKTRHNVGFILIDELAKKLGVKFKTKKNLRSEVAELNVDEQKIILAKPMTHINSSGEAVRILKNQFLSSDLLVIQDDATMEFGKIRVRPDGSAGGHNGIKSIITHFGSEKFTRFKFGVGEPPKNFALEDWVLSKFSKDEMQEIDKRKDELAEKIIAKIKG